MKEVLKFGLLGAAGWYLYEMYWPKTALAAATPQGKTITQTSGAPAAVAPSVPAVPAAPIVNTYIRASSVSDSDLMNAVSCNSGGASNRDCSLPYGAVKGVKLSSDEWNFWLGKQLNTEPPNVDLFPADNRGYAMTIDEYHNARKTHGLEGLRLR